MHTTKPVEVGTVDFLMAMFWIDKEIEPHRDRIQSFIVPNQEMVGQIFQGAP